jgi:hypothetical protein
VALRLDILANTRQFVNEMKQAGASTEDISDSLDELKRQGDKDIGALEKSFQQLAREASTTDKKIEGIGKGGFGKAGKASAEFKDEALANISEVTSSFDGSLESIGDLAQGTLGGITAAIPGIGIAAAGAAAAVGVITESFVKAQEATDEAKNSAYEYGLTLDATGQLADVTGRINELTGSVEGLKKVQDIANVSGWEQKEVLKALATGDGLPALTKAFNDGANSTDVAIGRLNELQGSLDGTRQGFDLASTGADVQASALYDLAKASGEASGEVDLLGNAVVTMPDGKKIVIDAETKKAYEDIDTLERKKFSDKNVNVRMTLDDWALRSYTPRTINVPVRFGSLRNDQWQVGP